MARLRNLFAKWLGLNKKAEQSPKAPHRGAQDIALILDGTLSSLDEGQETNAGLLYKLLKQSPALERPSLRYEAGVQWPDWRSTRDVIEGRGINRQIRRSYGFVSGRYREGDRIFLFGYSRGAFAVRSLAGLIDQVGLLKAKYATERNILQAHRLYQGEPDEETISAFRAAYCHPKCDVEMVGVWDTVKALGLPFPVLWRMTKQKHAFHSTHLGDSVRNGFQALALDETRTAFTPVMWTSAPNWHGHMEQMWFRGAHGDIGGQLGGYEQARPLANIPLVWMLECAEGLNFQLPSGWRDAIHRDVEAPSVGTRRGWGKLLISRRKRIIGVDPSEFIHITVPLDHPQKSVMAWQPNGSAQKN